MGIKKTILNSRKTIIFLSVILITLICVGVISAAPPTTSNGTKGLFYGYNDTTNKWTGTEDITVLGGPTTSSGEKVLLYGFDDTTKKWTAISNNILGTSENRVNGWFTNLHATNLYATTSVIDTIVGALSISTTTVSGDFTVQDSDGSANLYVENNSGNVGIGTMSPVSVLTVDGDQSVFMNSTDNNHVIRIVDTTASGFYLSNNESTPTNSDNSAFGMLSHGDQNQLVQFVSDGAGNQIVFANIANRTKDHDHAAQTNPTLFIHSDLNPDTNNTEWGSLSFEGTGSGGGYFNIANGTGDIVMQPNGNVGIGTTTPDNLLVVDDSGSFQVEELANCDTIDTDALGVFSCGTDASGGGFAFPWTATDYGMSTSTILGFTNGFMSMASSTVLGEFRIDGALTATSYGGITEANLVDKSAAGAISGAWDFTGAMTMVNATATNAFEVGACTGANIDFSNDMCVLDDVEIEGNLYVTGSASSTSLTVNGLFDVSSIGQATTSELNITYNTTDFAEFNVNDDGDLNITGSQAIATTTIEQNSFVMCNVGCTHGFKYFFGASTNTVESF